MLNTILVPAFLVILAILFIRLLESKLVFFPSKYPDGYWQTGQFATVPEDVFFETDDGLTLHGWFFARQGASATVLFLHGNAGNLSHRIDLISQMLALLPVEVFIIDYRGYGKSEGTPTEQGIYLDADAAYNYLTRERRRSPEQIILYGRSLGGAVAVDLATRVPAAGLLLEATFSSGTDMAREMFKILPVWWFTTIKMTSDEKIRTVNMPILVLHGTRDRVVPFRLGKKLFAAAPEPKTFVELPGADHHDTYVMSEDIFFRAIGEFIAQCVQNGTGRSQG